MASSKSNQVSFRCDDPVFAELEAACKKSERKPADFARLCVEACLRMLKDDEKHWHVPEVIRDVLDRRKRDAIPLAETKDSPFRHDQAGPKFTAKLPADDPSDPMVEHEKNLQNQKKKRRRGNS